MNEAQDSRDESRRRAAPSSRCDNYERYLEDEYGYAYFARDIVSIEEIERHDRFVESPADRQPDRPLDDDDDFSLLGLARGWKRADNIDAFIEVIEHLIASEEDHPAVAYHELPLLAAIVLSKAGEFDTAIALLDQGIEKWPDQKRPTLQHKALVLLQAGELEAASELHESLVRQHSDDPEVPYEIAEDLRQTGHPDRAEGWLDRAESSAKEVGDKSLLVDVELLRNRLQE